MAGWLAGWLVGWLAGWLVGWLVGWLAGWPSRKNPPSPPKNEKCKVSGTSREVPGDPENSQKSTKSRSFPKKKAFRAWIFADVCTQYRFSSFLRDFSSIFHGKNDGKSMQKTMHLFSASLVFLNMATLTKHCILRYESYFFSFCAFAFFCSRKTSQK